MMMLLVELCGIILQMIFNDYNDHCKSRIIVVVILVCQ